MEKKDRDEEKIEQMILNNFSNPEMKALIDKIASSPDKGKIKKNVLDGGLIEKYKRLSPAPLTQEEEEIIRTIYLYLCMEGKAEKIKKMMESTIKITSVPFARGSEKMAFLQWKDKKQKPPKLFE